MPLCPWQAARLLRPSPSLHQESLILRRDLKKPIPPMCKFQVVCFSTGQTLSSRGKVLWISRLQAALEEGLRAASSCPSGEAILTRARCRWPQGAPVPLCCGHEQRCASQREQPALGGGAPTAALADLRCVNTSTAAFFKLIVEEMGEQDPTQPGYGRAMQLTDQTGTF